MTPEPTQPAKSPEARAVALAELWYHADGFTEMAERGDLPDPKPWIAEALAAEHSGDCTKQPWSCMRCHAEEIMPVARWVQPRYAAMLAFAASTARPTDRGAVEALVTSVDKRLKRHLGSCGDRGLRQDVEDIIRSALALSATDQAAEVEDEGPIADAARRIASWSGNKVGVYKSAKRELAALATQPATGRTMGGEVENSPYVAGPVWEEDEDDCFTAEVQIVGGHEVVATVHGATREEAEQRQRAVLTALQNGGE